MTKFRKRLAELLRRAAAAEAPTTTIKDCQWFDSLTPDRPESNPVGYYRWSASAAKESTA